MKKTSKIAIAVLASATLIVGCGRATVPVVNYNDVPLSTSSSKGIPLNQVKKAIVAAAAVKGWTIEDKGLGKMTATLTVRQKHTVVVLITYTTTSFSINYVDSTDMKYGMKHGEPSIHPYYNDWVKELEQTIQVEISALS